MFFELRNDYQTGEEKLAKVSFCTMTTQKCDMDPCLYPDLVLSCFDSSKSSSGDSVYIYAKKRNFVKLKR